MDNYIAERVKLIEESATIAIANKAKQMMRAGIDVIDLGGGDPDFDTPRHIVEAAVTALRSGHTHYDLSRGSLELRKAISEKLSKDNGIQVDPEKEILVTPGGKQAILYAVLATINPGDEVLIPEPYWVSYPAIVSLAGGRVANVPTDPNGGFRLTAGDIAAKVTPRSRMIIITNPNNPTGVVLTEQEMREIAEVVERHDLLVICDEVYEKIIYDSVPFRSFASIDGMKDRTVTINSFSKTYAMTGWRLGYMVGPAWLISQALKVQQQSATCVCAFAQHGGVAALNGSQDCVREMVSEYQRRRDKMVSSLDTTGILWCRKPEGAFYLWIDIAQLGKSSTEVAQLLLERARVTSTPGPAFGASGEGFIRMNFAVPTARLQEAVQRIAKALR